MNRPPTAEGVLDRYRKFLNLVADFNQGPPDDKGAEFAALVAGIEFGDAWKRYEETRGPVTREWFQERFGGTEYVVARLGNPKSDCWWIVLYYDCFHGFPVVRLTFQTKPTAEYGMEWQLRLATRNQIEAMVELLGRKEP